jgi:hypothetical protein
VLRAVYQSAVGPEAAITRPAPQPLAIG